MATVDRNHPHPAPRAKALSEAEKTNLAGVRELAGTFRTFLASLGSSRELAIAKTKLDEAEMWAERHFKV